MFARLRRNRVNRFIMSSAVFKAAPKEDGETAGEKKFSWPEIGTERTLITVKTTMAADDDARRDIGLESIRR